VDIQEELEFHPALLGLISAVIEQLYPVKVRYRITVMNDSFTWTEAPTIHDRREENG